MQHVSRGVFVMLSKALFSSNSDEWATPQKLFDELNAEFNFSIDLAATRGNNKCEKFITEVEDSLSVGWHVLNGWLWLNPPYSNIKDWVKKCYEENLRGAKIVLLIPSRTGTRYFHDYIYHNPNVEIRFLKGRLKFSDSKNSAPFDSMVVIFK